MKQFALFDNSKDDNTIYTKKIATPVYEPKNAKPHLLSLYDDSKTHRLIREILASNIPIEEKEFLIAAARRHTVFNYEQIADYYAHSSLEMQQLMERNALVIIDFNNAIQYGYVNLCDQIKNQYLTEYQTPDEPLIITEKELIEKELTEIEGKDGTVLGFDWDAKDFNQDSIEEKDFTALGLDFNTQDFNEETNDGE